MHMPQNEWDWNCRPIQSVKASKSKRQSVKAYISYTLHLTTSRTVCTCSVPASRTDRPVPSLCVQWYSQSSVVVSVVRPSYVWLYTYVRTDKFKIKTDRPTTGRRMEKKKSQIIHPPPLAWCTLLWVSVCVCRRVGLSTYCTYTVYMGSPYPRYIVRGGTMTKNYEVWIIWSCVPWGPRDYTNMYL